MPDKKVRTYGTHRRDHIFETILRFYFHSQMHVNRISSLLERKFIHLSVDERLRESKANVAVYVCFPDSDSKLLLMNCLTKNASKPIARIEKRFEYYEIKTTRY